MSHHDLSFFVLGVPAPKGSLRHVGGGRLIEQVAASAPWRERVNTAALEAAADMKWFHNPHEPVIVTIEFAVPRPKTVRRLFPVTRGSGDIDKLCRNILDAISDTRKAPGVLRDDSCVIDLHAKKRFTQDSMRSGAWIHIDHPPHQER